jgi:hypothetical protein
MSTPWLKFYPSDWRAEPTLRMVSLAARGLWIELLCIMHEASPRGFLLINGKPLTARQIACLTGLQSDEVAGLMTELEEAGVFSRDDDRLIYSRRMVEDTERAERDKANGSKGGNPNLRKKDNPPEAGRLNGGVNPQDKAQKPEARSHSIPLEADASNAASAASDPTEAERDLFVRGKQVLGKNAGGLIAELKRHHGGNVALARADIERASQAHVPREFVGRVLHPVPFPRRHEASHVPSTRGSVTDELRRQLAEDFDRMRPDEGESLWPEPLRLVSWQCG